MLYLLKLNVDIIHQGRSQKGVGGGGTESSGRHNHSRFTTCTSCKEAFRPNWIDFEWSDFFHSSSWCPMMSRPKEKWIKMVKCQPKGRKWGHTYPIVPSSRIRFFKHKNRPFACEVITMQLCFLLILVPAVWHEVLGMGWTLITSKLFRKKTTRYVVISFVHC